MIKHFKCDETRKIFEREFSHPFHNIQKPAYRKLLILDAATNLNDLRVPPGNQLEKLSGNRKSQHSIRINQQYRLCFGWKNGDAYGAEIVDYH